MGIEENKEVVLKFNAGMAKGERGLLRVRLVASLYNHRVVF